MLREKEGRTPSVRTIVKLERSDSTFFQDTLCRYEHQAMCRENPDVRLGAGSRPSLSCTGRCDLKGRHANSNSGEGKEEFGSEHGGGLEVREVMNVEAARR